LRLPRDKALHVRLRWSRDDELPVGRLAWRDRRAFFEHSEEMLASGLELSPFKLRARRGVIEAPLEPFDGLFGAFSDSLPDGWGLLLQDRRAAKEGLSPSQLTPLDRLAWVGDTGIGALAYRPELLPATTGSPSLELDEMARQSHRLLSGKASDILPTLLRLGGSPHGAHPKVSVFLRPEDGHIDSNLEKPIVGHRLALVKFHALSDPADAGAIEIAYHHMAREAGLDVPDAWLLPSEEGAGWFAVERFDVQGATRRHVHTLCGLLHADHRLPSIDYVGALAGVHRLTRDMRALEQMYRRMVFNAVAHNRDDHTKQTSLCMDRRGSWTLSPAYDLTWSEGPGGEHSMAMSGEGHPQREDLLRVAAQCGVPPTLARRVSEEVVEVVTSRWSSLAREFGVSADATARVGRWIDRW